MEQLGSHRTDIHEILYFSVFENMSRKSKFHQNLTRISGISHEDLRTFMIKSRLIIIKMKNVSERICRKIKTHILHSITFFRKSFRLWDNEKNILQRYRAQMAIRRMRFACWISKATDSYSEYVIILSFPQLHWLHKRSSMLRLQVYFDSSFFRKAVLTERNS